MIQSLGGRHLVALFGVCVLAASSAAWAQQKQVLAPWNGEGSYVEEHAIDTVDSPGHQVRVYQLKFKYPKKDLAFLGVLVVESITTGMSDYTNKTGQFATYSVYTLEDGSKLFTKGGGTTQSDAGGARFSYVDTFVGGTGRFRGIRGQLRGNGERAAGAKSITNANAGEYWVEE